MQPRRLSRAQKGALIRQGPQNKQGKKKGEKRVWTGVATRSHLHIDILCLLSQGNRCFWSSNGFHSCCCLLSHRNNSTALPRQRAEQSLPSKKSSSQLITAPREQTCGVWSAGPDVPDVPAVPDVPDIPDGFVMWHWWGRDRIPS